MPEFQTTSIARKTLFICGHPRSGTTWTQLVVGAHPDAVTGRETHFIPHYIWPLYKTYHAQADQGSVIGLTHYMDEDTLMDALVRPAYYTILDRMRAALPDAPLLIEKTPRHVEFLPFIHKIADENLKVLHVIRDPRAVYASMKALSAREWGAFGRKTPEQFATRWANIMNRRARATALFGSRYREIQYEAMRTELLPVVTGIFEWLGLSADPQTVQDCISQNDLTTLRNAITSETTENHPSAEARTEFFRTGRTDGWRTELTEQEIAQIEATAANQMVAAGYEPVTSDR